MTGREDGEGRGPRGKDISPRRRTARVPVPSARGRIRARSGEGTGGAFGLSITRRAALLALVVGALALTVAVPLRTYLTQHAQVQQELNRQAELKATEQQLERRESQLSDPAHVEAEARQRLRMVMPGETPYTVQLPGDENAADQQNSPQQQTAATPWYEQLWESITGSGS